jgi:antitoxin component YwqK of YwqJK toxin-antitoxin module
MRFLSLLLLFLPAGLLAQKPYKGVKQISVYTKAAGDKESQLDYEMHFDRQGNQVKYHHPTHYCTETYEFDAQNRPTTREIMCGESFGNGTTAYKYSPTLNTSIETTGAYERIIIDSLNAQGLVRSRAVRTKALEESYTPAPDYRVLFAYNDRKQLTTETTISEGKQEIREYSYRKDSLQSIMRVRAGKKDTILLKDFYRDSGRLASKITPVSEGDASQGFYTEIFRYDEKGRILSVTRQLKDRKDCAKSPCTVSVQEYIYKNGLLHQIRHDGYSAGALESSRVVQYVGGLPKEEKAYNKVGEIVEVVTYKIQKW